MFSFSFVLAACLDLLLLFDFALCQIQGMSSDLWTQVELDHYKLTDSARLRWLQDHSVHPGS